MTDTLPLQILDASTDKVAVKAVDLIDLLEKHAGIYGDKTLYYYLEDGEKETDRKSYAQIQSLSRAIAVELLSKTQAGERALLLFPVGIEFVAGLFGCFYSGVIAVPAYPPRKNRSFERFKAIISNCQPSVVLTTTRIFNDLQKNFAEEDCIKGMKFIIYEEISNDKGKFWKNPGITPDTTALLQYTSGSTGKPNGVILSHSNILHNSAFIYKAFGHSENSFGVNWLPPFHDMGLIGALIQPMYIGCANLIMPPTAFLLRPQNWLRAIGRYKASTSGGPNFAFDYCVDRIKPEDKKDLDLSHIKPFFCGAEPIRKQTIERFIDSFKECGLTSNQIYPCYGLAESVLIVTGGDLDAEPVYFYADEAEISKGIVVKAQNNDDKARPYVGCGYPMAGTKVVIVDPATSHICQRGKIGEIWVSGPSVAQGYWNDPQATGEVFNTFLNDGEGPFMRTGDLGFIEDGQLFITGRLKDLLIIRGLNYYPQDIEATVEESHDAIALSTAVAFTIEDEKGEKLVVVAEIKRSSMKDLQSDKVIEAIRQSITEVHGLQPAMIILARPGNVPKTSSGKNQRYECRKMLIEGSLEEIARWEATTFDQAAIPQIINEELIHRWIKLWMAKELNIDPLIIDIDKPVTAYGLDSMKAIILAHDAEEEFNIEWPLEMFLEITTIRKIADTGMELMRNSSTLP